MVTVQNFILFALVRDNSHLGEGGELEFKQMESV